MNHEHETSVIKKKPSNLSDNMENLHFFQLSWPIIIEHFLYLLIPLVDALLLSHISITSAAAVGSCSFVISFTLIAIIGFSQSASICISHCLGEGNKLGAQSVARASLFIVTTIGLCLGIVQFCLHKQIPLWLGLSEEVGQKAGVFLQIVGGTTFVQAFITVFSFILRAYGQQKKPMYVAICVSIINIILACSFTSGWFGLPHLDVLGVAIATFFARFFGMILILYFGYKYLNQIFYLRYLKQDLNQHSKKIVSFGVPICLEPLSYQGSQIIITRVIALLGAEALALRTYVWSIINFNTIFVFGFAQATQILVGRFYGAKLYDDAKREFERNLKLSLFASLAMVTTVLLAGKIILSFFTSDTHMINTGCILLALGYFMEPGRTGNVITGSALRAVGDPKFPLYTGLIFMWGLSIPVAWFFGIYLNLGLIGIWFGLACDEVIRASVNYRQFQKNKWALPTYEKIT